MKKIFCAALMILALGFTPAARAEADERGLTGGSVASGLTDLITTNALAAGDTLKVTGAMQPADWEALKTHSGAVFKLVLDGETKSIPEGALENASKIQSIEAPSVTTVERRAFWGCESLTDVTLPKLESIGFTAFANCASLTSVTLPEGLTSISNTFVNCTSLTSVTLPGSLTSISGAFQGCTNLRSVTLPEDLTSIGTGTFGACKSLADVTLPKSLESIEPNAFRNCTSLTGVTLPESLESIESSAFAGCTSLTSATFEGTTPPTLGNNALPASLTEIKVPEESVELYKDALATFNYTNLIITPVPNNTEVPKITTHPQSVTYTQGAKADALFVNVENVSDGGTLSYQWYSSTADGAAGTVIDSAIAAAYTPSTVMPGTMYYYVVVTNTVGPLKATTTSRAAAVTVSTPQPPAPPYDPGPYTPPNTPSDNAAPTAITAGSIEAQKQPDGSYLLTVPSGTDITKFRVTFTLPKGATVSPDNGSEQDFSQGPVTYTITAEDKKTTEKIVIAVKTEQPPTTEKPMITPEVSASEAAYTTNADGTVAVNMRLPLADGADPAQIEAMRTTLAGFTPTALSFAWVDAEGNVTPITASSRSAANVTPPYLQISFTAKSADDLKKGSLTKLEYWLAGDETTYTQTLSLAFGGMTLTDETPAAPETPETSGGGCDAGAGVIGVLALALCTAQRKR